MLSLLNQTNQNNIQNLNQLNKPAFEAFYANVKGLFVFAPEAYRFHKEERLVVYPFAHLAKILLYSGIRCIRT